MNNSSVISLLHLRENVSLSFVSPDNPDRIYETVCAFANRFGGEILIADFSGPEVKVLEESQMNYLCSRIVDDCSDRNLFVPPLFISPRVVPHDNGFILHLHVNSSSYLVTYKNNVYHRERAQNVFIEDKEQKRRIESENSCLFFESKVFPYIGFFDLRIDLLPKIRRYATSGQGKAPRWIDLNDHELINSSGLGVMDRVTGQKGFNLAAVLLLGKEQIVHEVIPHYSTVFECRRGNADVKRIVVNNLFESSGKLSEYLMQSISDLTSGLDLNSADSISRMLRELVTNSLIHRDFRSSIQAKIIVNNDEIIVENASKPSGQDLISPSGIGYYAKNPLIEQFFYSLGFASLQGSGICTIFSVCKDCLHSLPVFENDEVFRCTIPLKAQNTVNTAQIHASDSDQTENKTVENQNVRAVTSDQTDNIPSSLNQKLNFIKNVQLIRKQQTDRSLNDSGRELPKNSSETDQTEQKNISNHTVVTASQDYLNKLEEKQHLTYGQTQKSDKTDKKEQIKTGEYSPQKKDTESETTNRPRLTIRENESGWLPFADPQIELLNIIKLYPKMTNVELAKTLGWSPSKIKFYVQKLKKAGVVSRMGTDRKGYWKVF